MPDDESKFLDPIEPPDTTQSPTGFEWLQQDGVHIRPPGDIGPDQIRGCLWELIYALVVQGIFIANTDHLDDAGLYAWLYNECLRRSNRFRPLAAEEHDQVNVIGTGSEEDTQLWLRFYADEVLRAVWSRDFPDDPVPPSEPAPFDRDRWLPQPASSPSATEAEEPAPSSPDEKLFSTPFDELRDPLQLEAVDREIQRDQPAFEADDMEIEVNELYLGGADSTDSSDALLREPAVGVQTEHWQNPHDELIDSGVILPPPEELTDEALPAKLWELLHEMACRGFYLLHTNHFSDRELYTRLWRENLREPAMLPEPKSEGGWYHDFIGSGDAEEVRTWLRYYANDLDRERHAQENPGQMLPPRHECPFSRDHRLPKGPFS